MTFPPKPHRGGMAGLRARVASLEAEAHRLRARLAEAERLMLSAAALLDVCAAPPQPLPACKTAADRLREFCRNTQEE